MAAIVLEDVRKSYGGTLALAGLSLTVCEGEILGLLGPNGAGKTTTVGIVCGLLVPDSGRVDVGGAGSPCRPQARRLVGVAPQSLALYEALGGRENLEFFASLHGITGAARRRAVFDALEFVGLADRAGDRVATYSGGMKRRLNVAAALVHDPPVLVLDEPTVGVDPQSRNLLLENVAALRARGRTIVDHGRLLALGTVPALLAEHGGPPCLVVETDGCERRIETNEPLTDLQAIARAGRVDSFRVERARLEDVFLRLTGRRLRD